MKTQTFSRRSQSRESFARFVLGQAVRAQKSGGRVTLRPAGRVLQMTVR